MNYKLNINPKRLEQFLYDFAQIGKTKKGGVTRLALTDLDKQARDLFVFLAKKAGCTIKIDAMGNIFARRAGKDPNLAAVLTGSHGDSQPQGGRFDGIYGVLAGLEVIYSLNDYNIQTKHPIDLVMWTNEEGARFAPAMIGSAVFCSLTPLSEGLSKTDLEGKTIASELQRIGYAGVDNFDDYKIHAAIELHIEQGPILEKNNKLIGTVTGALGQKWYDVAFKGMAAHAGTTPMDCRKDALLGLSETVCAIHEIGMSEMPDGRATVGMVNILPNSRNVVPAQSNLSVEFRHPEKSGLKRMHQKLCQSVETIAQSLQLEAEIKSVLSFDPIYFNQNLVQIIREVSEQLGFSHQDITSGAGHDACNLNKITPTAMIFIPCVNGISHNEQEDITSEWAVAGAQVLLNTLVQIAQ